MACPLAIRDLRVLVDFVKLLTDPKLQLQDSRDQVGPNTTVYILTSSFREFAFVSLEVGR